MPVIVDFPWCCSAKVIAEFGGGHVGQIEGWPKRELVKWLAHYLTQLKKECASVVAIPTTTQPNAIAALEEIGFYMHPDGEKGGGKVPHSSAHRVTVMFLPLNEWDSKEFSERYDPKKDKYVDKPNSGAVFKKESMAKVMDWY